MLSTGFCVGCYKSSKTGSDKAQRLFLKVTFCCCQEHFSSALWCFRGGLGLSLKSDASFY